MDPSLAVEVSDLSLWVRPAFGTRGTKPKTPFGVCVRASRGERHARTNPPDVENAEGTVRDGRESRAGS